MARRGRHGLAGLGTAWHGEAGMAKGMDKLYWKTILGPLQGPTLVGSAQGESFFAGDGEIN